MRNLVEIAIEKDSLAELQSETEACCLFLKRQTMTLCQVCCFT